MNAHDDDTDDGEDAGGAGRNEVYPVIKGAQILQAPSGRAYFQAWR